MYGDASRMAAGQLNQIHGATTSYAYDDCWTWDIKREKWRREKLHGNIPSPRSEMGCTYVSMLIYDYGRL